MKIVKPSSKALRFLLYESDWWNATKTIATKLETFQTNYLRHVKVYFSQRKESNQLKLTRILCY